MSTYPGNDQYPVFVALPDDGEPATAESIAAQAKALADRTAYLLRRSGSMSGTASPIRVKSIDGASVIVYPISGLAVYDTAPHVLSTVAQDTVLAPPLSANTWYYVYAYYNRVVSYEFSTTAPNIHRVFKNGTTSHAYMCSLRTDGAGAIRPFYRERNVTSYGAQYAAVTGGTATTATDQSLATMVPPSSVQARCTVTVVSASTGYAALKPKGWPAEVFINCGSQKITAQVDVLTDDSQVIQWRVDAGTSSADIKVIGYME